jgi:hypothetical protein
MTTPLFDYEVDGSSQSSILRAPSGGGQSGIGLSGPQPESGGGAAQVSGDDLTLGQALFESFRPVSAAREGRRRQQETDLHARQVKSQELTAALNALKEGVDMTTTLEGDQRTAFVQSFKGKLDKFEDGLGSAFENLVANPETAGAISEWAQDSDTLKRALQVGGVKGAKKLLTSPEALKTIQAEIDTKRMPVLLRKGQTFIAGWQQLVPAEMAERFNKDGRISASELVTANEWIKEKNPDIAKTLAFSDRDLEVVARNSDAFYHSLGIVSPKDEGAILTEQAKRESRPPPGRTRKVNRDGKVMDQAQTWDGQRWVDEGEATPHFKPDAGGLTASQQRTNDEIDGARTRIEAMTDEDIKRATQSKTATGADNPAYDAQVARDARLAMRKKFGDDVDFDRVNERVSGQNKQTRELQNSYDGVRKQLADRLASASGSMKAEIQKRIEAADAEAKKRGLIVRKSGK